jgi:uncharacterized membrane protein YcgQ (UPF0703/DUF1980 family)
MKIQSDYMKRRIYIHVSNTMSYIATCFCSFLKLQLINSFFLYLNISYIYVFDVSDAAIWCVRRRVHCYSNTVCMNIDIQSSLVNPDTLVPSKIVRINEASG